MFDRRLEVAGHPCRQPEALLVVALYPLVFGLQTRERVVGVGTQRRDAHQPDELAGRRADCTCAHSSSTRSGRPMSTPPRATSPSRLIWMYTRSGSDRAAVGQRLRRRPVQRGDQLGAVDRVRGVGPAGDRPRLVALNPADHVPANRRSGLGGIAFGRFRGRFLFARFTKSMATQSRQNKDIGCWKEFRNRQQFNFVACCARRRPRPAASRSRTRVSALANSTSRVVATVHRLRALIGHSIHTTDARRPVGASRR